MEEKERYEYIHNDEIGDGILDIKTNNEVYDIEQMSDLLNQQDKEIKDLQNDNEWLCDERQRLRKYVDGLIDEHKQLKEESGYIIFSDGYDENGNEVHKQEFVKYKDKFRELLEEIKQLKQSQKQQVINVLEELHLLFRNGICDFTTRQYVCTIIENQIKELKGEKNEL